MVHCWWCVCVLEMERVYHGLKVIDSDRRVFVTVFATVLHTNFRISKTYLSSVFLLALTPGTTRKVPACALEV